MMNSSKLFIQFLILSLTLGIVRGCSLFIEVNGTDSEQCGQFTSTACLTIEGAYKSCQNQFNSNYNYDFNFGSGVFNINSSLTFNDQSGYVIFSLSGQSDNSTIFDFSGMSNQDAFTLTSTQAGATNTLQFYNIIFQNFNGLGGNDLFSSNNGNEDSVDSKDSSDNNSYSLIYFSIGSGAGPLSFTKCIFNNINGGKAALLFASFTMNQPKYGSADISITGCQFSNSNVESLLYSEYARYIITQSTFTNITSSDTLLDSRGGSAVIQSTTFKQNTATNTLVNWSAMTGKNFNTYYDQTLVSNVVFIDNKVGLGVFSSTGSVFTINSNAFSNTNGPIFAFTSQRNQIVLISNNIIYQGQSSVLSISGSSNITFVGNTISQYSNFQSLVSVKGDSSNITISSNIFQDNEISTGVLLDIANSNTTVVSNILSSNTLSNFLSCSSNAQVTLDATNNLGPTNQISKVISCSDGCQVNNPNTFINPSLACVIDPNETIAPETSSDSGTFRNQPSGTTQVTIAITVVLGITMIAVIVVAIVKYKHAQRKEKERLLGSEKTHINSYQI